MTDAAHGALWHSLVDAASAPYRRAGRFAWHFARGKLRWDPVFRHLIAHGLIEPKARVLDIGCGQGLLASLLAAADAAHRTGRWASGWAAAPAGARVTGIELMERDVERGRRALGDGAAFVCADMRSADFPPVDAVVILDVLHYITVAEQDAVLERVRAALGDSGRLVLRVGDASVRGRFAASQWVDRVVTAIRGHRVTPTFGRPLAEWKARLAALGFRVTSRPMHEGTPFANILLVGDVGPAAP
jgi:2-polyprenyl-3-methyl-5-hydroxy-6-metoxy-1,4-benzoquinol methylase